MRPKGDPNYRKGSGGGGPSDTKLAENEPAAVGGGASVVTTPALLPAAQSVSSVGLAGYPIRVGMDTSMNHTMVSARIELWAFDSKGHFSYGSPDGAPYNLAGGTAALTNWFPAAREVLVREHVDVAALPNSLSHTSLLQERMNTHFRVVVNAGKLLMLAELAAVDPAFSVLARELPRVRARLVRLLERLDTVAMPTCLYEAEIPAIPLQVIPGILRPVVQLFRNDYELAAASGGPPEMAQQNSSTAPDVVLTNYAELDKFVKWLEDGEYWLRMGASAIAADFRSLTDMVNQSLGSPTLGKSFTRGLLSGIPKLSPVAANPDILADFVGRALCWKSKVDGGTDKWGAFPISGDVNLHNWVPVMSFGQHSMRDELSMGAPKFIAFEPGEGNANVGLYVLDVDTPFWCDGNMHRVDYDFTNAHPTGDVRQHFGTTNDMGYVLHDGTINSEGSAIDWTDTAEIMGFLTGFDTRLEHVMAGVMPSIMDDDNQGRFPYERLEEADGVSVAFVDPNDIITASIVRRESCFAIPQLSSYNSGRGG